MTAARTNDSSSPDQILGVTAEPSQGSRAALAAMQRWESEGGAVPPARAITPASARHAPIT